MNNWFDKDGPVSGLRMNDRGLQYGDGLFETIAIRDGHPRLWRRHMQRLETGCTRLSIPFPSADGLLKLVADAVKESGAEHADVTAKILVTAGQGERGYARPSDPLPTCRVGIFESRVPNQRWYADGVDLLVCDTRLAEQPALAGLKTLNRLEQVLGRMEVGSAFEGLMCDVSGRLICGTMSNVFIAKDNRIVTPELNRCGVDGVARAEILDAAPNAGSAIQVRDIPLEECLQADEILLSNSLLGLLPARRLNDRVLTGRNAYERLRPILVRAGFNECDL